MSGRDNDLYKSDLIKTSKMEFAKYLQLTQDDCLMHAWSKKTMEEYVVNSGFDPPHPINPVGAMQRIGGSSDDLEASIEEVFPDFEDRGIKANAFLAALDTGRSSYSFKDIAGRWKPDYTADKTNVWTFVQFYFIPEEYLFVQKTKGILEEPSRTRAQLRKG